MNVEPWKPVINWLQRQYPRPTINQEWLKNCVSALQASDQPPPNTRELIHATETQLLLSHLANSCLPNTGLPVEEVHDRILFEKEGCLVMILSIQEIGASAFSLRTTMDQRKEVLSGVTRIRRMKDPGEEEGDEDENEGDEERLPAYSRSMLSLELTDGFTVMKAMEYRRIPELVLGETMLGAKMILRNVKVLRNTLLLTPTCVTLKDHWVEELEVLQSKMFMNGLRRRMGQEELPLEDEEVDPVAGNENVDENAQIIDVDMDVAPIPPRAVERQTGLPDQRPEERTRVFASIEGRLRTAGEEFLDPGDQAGFHDEDGEQPIAGPSWPSVRRGPPGGGRFTLVPKLPGLTAKLSKPIDRMDEADESFDIMDPPEDELAEILDATSAAMAANVAKDADGADWAVMDEMDMDTEIAVTNKEDVNEESRYFGATGKKGKGKEVVKTKKVLTSTANGRMKSKANGRMKSKAVALSKEEQANSRPQSGQRTTRSTTPSSSKCKQPLFGPEDADDDAEHQGTDEDSQKENRPTTIEVDAGGYGETSARVRRRDREDGKSESTKDDVADDVIEWREVIELSD